MTVHARQLNAASLSSRDNCDLSAPIMQRLAHILVKTSGMQVDASKSYLVENKLRALVTKYGLSSVAELVGQAESGAFPELSNDVVQSMTINETHFFRDHAPFTSLARVLSDFAQSARPSRSFRIWSAASSTGQEIYSVAMTIEQEASKLANLKIELVASDISEAVIAKAAAGEFSRFEIDRGLSPQQIARFFHPVGKNMRIDDKLRRQVTFRCQNLLEDFSHLGLFDVVFCRNVLIYFNDDTRHSILKRLAAQLQPGGRLILGSAETMLAHAAGYEADPRAPGFLRVASPSRAVSIRN